MKGLKLQPCCNPVGHAHDSVQHFAVLTQDLTFEYIDCIDLSRLTLTPFLCYTLYNNLRFTKAFWKSTKHTYKGFDLTRRYFLTSEYKINALSVVLYPALKPA